MSMLRSVPHSEKMSPSVFGCELSNLTVHSNHMVYTIRPALSLSTDEITIEVWFMNRLLWLISTLCDQHPLNAPKNPFNPSICISDYLIANSQ